MPVIVGESQEAAYISYRDWFWPVHYCGSFLGICFYTLTGDYVTQISDFGLKKLIFTRLEFKPSSGQFGKHCLHSLDMFLWCLGKDNYIIQIDDAPIEMQIP